MCSQSQNPFKWRHFQADIILLCVRWYLRYAARLSRPRGNDAGACAPRKWRESTSVKAVGRPSLHLTYPCQLAETSKEEGDDSMSGSAPKETYDLLSCESTTSLR